MFHHFPSFPHVGKKRGTAGLCQETNIPGQSAPVQVEFYTFLTVENCLSATVNGFNAVRTFPKVATETVLDPCSGRVGVTGGAA